MATLKRHLRNVADLLLGKEPWVFKQLTEKVVWLGNQGAGFFVCPNLIQPNAIVYSFGIGEDISFDKALIDLFQCKVYGFDPTPKSIEFIKNNPIEGFEFSPVGLSDHDGELTFYLPDNPQYVSCTTFNRWGYDESAIKPIQVPVKQFTSITQELGHQHIDILKIDIEGSEYDVIDGILSSGVSIDQILVEFHHRFKEISPKQTKNIIKKLNSFGYYIAAISDNREEYTFIKKLNK